MKTRIVAKTLIFNDAGQVLLVVRGAKQLHRPNGYDLPGGRVEAGESAVEAAVREAQEEVSLTLDPQQMQLVYGTAKAGYNPWAQQEVNIVWLGYITKLSGTLQVTLSSEHQAYEWRTLDEAIKVCEGTTQCALIEHVKTHNLTEQLA